MALHLHIPPEPLDRPSQPAQNRCAELTATLINALAAVPDHHHRAALTAAALHTISAAIRATLDAPETQH